MNRSVSGFKFLAFTFVLLSLLTLMTGVMFAQETTGGLQGTVKDPSGALVSNAQVVISGTTLIGAKEAQTDSAGYYHFTNLPPGTYSVTVTAKGFETLKSGGLVIEVGHLPSLDLKLEVGAGSTVVEVSGQADMIDVTTETTQTNVTSDVIQDVPHGRSFQSVIQFAPSARNEPLAGSLASPMSSGGSGTGGQSPGSSGNGQAFGYSVAGGSDSENSYLVEGQETADSIGGFSHTNVPFDFIQEVQVKSSGIEAEHGGSLGGVVNVIMKKGSNGFHGSLFSSFEAGSWDGSPNAFSRYDPTYTQTLDGSGTAYVDPGYQQYQAKKDKLDDIMPGGTIGGAIIKDKVWFFAGFNPEFRNRERDVYFGGQGETPFSSNQQTYYTNARIDVALTKNIRVFASWLYQYQRESGQDFPFADSTTGLLNPSTSCFGTFTSASNPCTGSGTPPFSFAHNLGFAAPNTTFNLGLDYTITTRLIATFRWGNSFQNYHDFGFPTGGTIQEFGSSGAGALDNTGAPIPSTSPLSQTSGYQNVAANINTTTFDATHHNQIDASLAWFKSGWGGTHNIKVGYQLNHLSNSLLQHWNEPEINVFPGQGNFYNVQDPAIGGVNCASYVALYGGCAGQYGYLTVQDYGSSGKATSVNHGFFFQDAWTTGHGITLNGGLRIEKEYLPAEDQPAGGISKPINFGWGDKIAPRIGAAWDVFRDGRMKVFGSYGVFNDIMKLNLAISSFGGQYWQNCAYAMDTDALNTFTPQFDSAVRDCVGPNGSSQANFAGGVGATPAGYTFLENQNFRTFPTSCATCTATEEGVAPGLKPYRQHDSVFGVDYQIAKNLAFEARWDRVRLDHAIEDSAIYNPAIGETFVIVNPGQGASKTFDGFWNFLYGAPSGCGTAGNIACPPNIIAAARSYDGIELRLTKAASKNWFGMFSYTYSNFRGNYTGLTSTDIGDGFGGRNAPNNSRSFDEPFFSWSANGDSASGPLPTDRPSAFKGYAYYELHEGRKLSSDFGIFQFLYSGTPQTSILDVGYSFAPPAGAFPTDVAGRGKWMDFSQDPTTGAITASNPYTNRTPWYTETDFNITQNYHLSETKVLSFTATIPNLLNQRAVTALYPLVDSQNFGQFAAPQTSQCLAYNTANYALASSSCFIYSGVAAYSSYMSPYNVQALLNTGTQGNTVNGGIDGGTATINSQYGKPFLYQISRTIRLGVKFTF
jgi:Carboxypeptidase regulatory-like domain